jgi:hypothetical protein
MLRENNSIICILEDIPPPAQLNEEQDHLPSHLLLLGQLRLSACWTQCQKNRGYMITLPHPLSLLEMVTNIVIDLYSHKSSHEYVSRVRTYRAIRLWLLRQKTYNTEIVWSNEMKLLIKENFKWSIIIKFDKIYLMLCLDAMHWAWNWGIWIWAPILSFGTH